MPASGVRGFDFWAVQSWLIATQESFVGTGLSLGCLTDVRPMMGMLRTRDCFDVGQSGAASSLMAGAGLLERMDGYGNRNGASAGVKI